MRIRDGGFLPLLLVVAGCASLVSARWDDRFGEQRPSRYDTPLRSTASMPSFRRDVLPILESRCVVCHACYDAPCQLNLASYDGVTRGASSTPVYGTRLQEAVPTRLFVDAQRPSAWRSLGFHPVLNERRADPQADRLASLLWQTLEQKARHPLPAGPVLGSEFDFSLNRPHQCVPLEGFDAWAKTNPLAGMPYALPGLSVGEREKIGAWLSAGAPADEPDALPEGVQQQIVIWEAFFNRSDARAQLAARYIYEHVFLAHLYFSDDPSADGRPHWFRLVRSVTPPGQPIDVIATRQPVDAPGRPFWYRLQPYDESIVAKTHLPFRLDAARMARWQEWLVDGLPPLATLPPHSINPFETYRAIPVERRYRFLLDEAAFFVGGFIKGPVCRGQVALNVINDRFWVFFAAPETHDARLDEFIANEAGNLRLPGEDVDAIPLVSWRLYRKLEDNYLDGRARFLQQRFGTNGRVSLDHLWQGEGRNPNAALTVFRHFDSATVLQGLQGDNPKTAWLLTYPVLERIHYLLVAGFDVFGNVGHQLNSRLYMDFLRMEAETNFIALLPKPARQPVVEHWYRGAAGEILEKFFKGNQLAVESGVRFPSPSAGPLKLLDSLFDQASARMASINKAIRPSSLPDPLRRLAAGRGNGLQYLPETAFLRVEGKQGPQDYTMLRNSAHSNISYFFAERWTRLPQEDSLTVLPGLVGAYPNVLFRVREGELDAFVTALQKIASHEDYRALADQFAVRRTSPQFWEYWDALNQTVRAEAPIYGGLFDLSRLENR